MANFNNNNGKQIVPAPQGWVPSDTIRDSRCSVCTSRWRLQIDQELLMGASYAALARKYQQEYGDDAISRGSLQNHKKKHMTIEQEALREIIEQRYEEHNGSVKTAVGILLGQKSVLEILAIKGYKSVISGETKVEVKDLISILQEIQKMSEKETDVEKEDMKRDFAYFTQSVQETVPKDMWESIAAKFNQKLANAKPRLLEQLVDLKAIETLEAEILGEDDGRSAS